MKTKTLIILIILIGLVIGGFFIWKNISVPDEEKVEEEVPLEGVEWFQTGNTQDITKLKPKQSNELEDNRIGIHAHCFWNPEGQGVFPEGILDSSTVLELGVKRVRLAIKSLDAPDPDFLIAPDGDFEPELSIDPTHDNFITTLVNNGITITYVLSFWDTEYVAQGGEVRYPRFKTEEEIQRYLDYVQFIVHHFKNRIQYYEIWNEPNIENTIQWIEVDDYIKLVKRTVPVIKEEYSEAKIVVGSTSELSDLGSQDYLFSILRSDVMPLVDIVAWHPMYGVSPEYEPLRQYYYEYPVIVQEIKDIASAHGFTGKYVADEIHWCTLDLADPDHPWNAFTETKSAKYLTRGILMHLGMDVTVSHIPLLRNPNLFKAVQNLSTIMPGAESTELSIEIQSEATNIVSYSFSLASGDKLITLWTDDIAVDEDSGVNAKLTISNFSAQEVTGIDVLNGYQQSIITNNENGNLVIENLIVRDYPLILKIKK